MFFGYTFCPDACPTALNNISAALEGLGPNADKLQPLFIIGRPSRRHARIFRASVKASAGVASGAVAASLNPSSSYIVTMKLAWRVRSRRWKW